MSNQALAGDSQGPDDQTFRHSEKIKEKKKKDINISLVKSNVREAAVATGEIKYTILNFFDKLRLLCI